MHKSLAITAALIGIFLSGCATQSNIVFPPFQAEDLNTQVQSGSLLQKIDSFFVINDSSSSMSDAYTNSLEFQGTKLDAEKILLYKLKNSIPNIPLFTGLRSFGQGPCLGWKSSRLNHTVQKYSPRTFDFAINSLQCSSGGTPLAAALYASRTSIANAPGKTALIVFSDGVDKSPAAQTAAALKAQYGDKLCIYTVWVGNKGEEAGQSNLQKISEASNCGISTTASALSTPTGMSDFVKSVFFNPAPPAPVDCSTLDDDQDGVNNCLDTCPDTPQGAFADRNGCWAFHGVLFDFDSDIVKDKYNPVIDNAVRVLELNPELTVEIQGHTDSIGTEAYNQGLSERRANSVKTELLNHGIAESRLSTIGFGELQPVESNATSEGRAYNRRVVYKRTDR